MSISVSVQSVVMLHSCPDDTQNLYSVSLFSCNLETFSHFSFDFWFGLFPSMVFHFQIGFSQMQLCHWFPIDFVHSESILCMVEIFLCFLRLILWLRIFFILKYLMPTWAECNSPVVRESAVFDLWWEERESRTFFILSWVKTSHLSSSCGPFTNMFDIVHVVL